MSKRFRRGYVLALLTGACILVLEIAAARLVAPILGVSLFSWTSVIGIVLAGMAVGQYLGGHVADRAPSSRTLGILLYLSGLASLSILPLLALADNNPDLLFGIPAIPRTFGLSAMLFFTPSVLIGTIAPVIVKLGVTSLDLTGRAVGWIYALSNLGSIAGVFATGFVLISSFGSRWVVFGVGLTLLGLAITLGELFRFPRALATLALPSIGMLYLIQATAALEGTCNRESQYYCIRWHDANVAGRSQPIRVLTLDRLEHSYNALDDTRYLRYGYLKVYAEITDHVARFRPGFRALFIGGGGYTLPRYLEREYPEAIIDVIEIDPSVTEIAYNAMGLPVNSRVRTYGADGREVIQTLVGDGEHYDIIFGDAFHDIAVPYHLTTEEFARLVRSLLTEDGVYLVNVVDKFPDGLFLPSMMITLQRVFPHVYLMTDVPSTAPRRRESMPYVVGAKSIPLDRDGLRLVRGQGVGGAPLTRVLGETDVAGWLRSAGGVFLTDDYVPTDNLLAPAFAER